MSGKYLLLLFLFCASFTCPYAQQIRGLVQDRESREPLANVQLMNIYDNSTVFTDSAGGFVIAARKGELIELRCAGYNLARFRLSKGDLPHFFKLYLDKITVLNTDRFASSGLTQFQIDSIKSRELYRKTLEYPRMTTFEAMESPFTALSRSNQQKWAFQESYALFEQEKYIDFTFNETLVKQLTGLEGAELQRYMKLYRPAYDALRSMSLYDYYSYIRQSAEHFRRMDKPATPRNSG